MHTSVLFAASETGGLRIGEAHLVPFLDVDTHYVFNPGRLNKNAISDMITVSRPGMRLSLESESLKLNLSSEGEYQYYYGIEQAESKEFSTFAGALNLSADINRGSPLGIRVFNALVRSAQPGNETATGRMLHTYNNLGLGADYQPGGGALQFSGDYVFFIDYYDRTTELGEKFNPAALDNLRHMPSFNLTWRFLPKTAAFIDAQGQFTDYYSNGAFYNSSTTNPNSTLFTSHMGLVGNLSTLVKVLLKAGYGASMIEGTKDNLSTAVGQLEIEYQLGAKDYLKVGFKRDIKPTALFKYYGLMRGYVEYRRSLNHRWNISAKLNYDDMRYGSALAGADNARVDGSVMGNLGVTYQALAWLDVIVTESFESRTSNYVIEGSNDATGYFFNDFNITVRFKY
ncbi:MAG: hypothetical protein CMH60_05705 [Myxococcales bacterium]|nr:hypothetical protein [Myxococcales bacterium]